jgi:hypothetical protein
MTTEWLTRSACAGFCLGASLASPALFAAEDEFELPPIDFRVETSAMYDTNIARSRGPGNVLSDHIYNVNAAASFVHPLTENMRLKALGTAGYEAFSRYSRLSRFFLSAEGELQYRPSGEFAAPTFGLLGRAAVDFYDSTLRDGYRYNIEARVLQPLTDLVDVFAAIGYNIRDGKSKVFDLKDWSARVNFDYALAQKSTLYLGLEYRYGQSASSALPELAFVDIAQAIVRDDAFDDGRGAYRLKARTGIATLGFSHGLQEDQSLDFSLRWVQSTALDKPTFPGAGTIRYYDVQASVAYLIRF